MMARIAGIVLAGGRSARFGRDKLVEPIGGQPMVEYAIVAVGQVADVVLLVTAPDSGPGTTSSPNVRLVHDVRPFGGPLAGLATGLDALDPTIERVIAVGGDMPTLVPAVLRRLVDGLDKHEAVVLADDTGPRPLPIALRRSAAGPVAEELLAAGERRLRALFGVLDLRVIAPATWRQDDPDGASLRDVDTPEDLPSRG